MYDISRKEVVFERGNDNTLYFNSPFSSGDKYVDRGKALLYEGQGKEGIVFVHGLGSRNFYYLKYYPENLVKHGYTIIMPVLPYHFERMPKDEKIDFLSGTAVDIENRFYQSVADILACVDYLENRGMEKIHIIGFSFGGMIGTIAKALDNRLDKGIFIVSGGNFLYITWKSVATKVLRVRYEDEDSCSIERCHRLHENFDDVVKDFTKLEELKNLPSCFRYDPSLFAKMINPENILMINAAFDPFIPRKASKDLWNKMGRPKRYILPSGHLTSHLWFKRFIFKKTIGFLKYQ
jgi:esterase/lipase